MYYVYILKLSNGDYYTGRSDNLKRRFKEHNTGRERTTKYFLPVELIMYLGFKNKTSSIKFEKYLKTGSGIAFRRKHLI